MTKWARGIHGAVRRPFWAVLRGLERPSYKSYSSLLFLLTLPLVGCAGWRPAAPPPSISKQRQEREADAVRYFEEQRDTAQLQAALDRWAQGDIAGCESRLRGLLARRADNCPVRLRLAELLWTRGDAAAAEQELRQVLTDQPKSAEAHHLLGLLLAEQDRVADAHEHLASAADLEPSNELFRETRDAY